MKPCATASSDDVASAGGVEPPNPGGIGVERMCDEIAGDLSGNRSMPGDDCGLASSGEQREVGYCEIDGDRYLVGYALPRDVFDETVGHDLTC